jgi:hypothetical protein
MVVICVEKAWLKAIGNIAEELSIQSSEEDRYVKLIAGYVKPGLFVEAELVRNKADKSAILSHIPSSAISGMFDMTESEAVAIGFHPVHK